MFGMDYDYYTEEPDEFGGQVRTYYKDDVIVGTERTVYSYSSHPFTPSDIPNSTCIGSDTEASR